MEPFNKCPQCGELDERRTQCACGYPDAVSTTPPPPRTESISHEPSSSGPTYDRIDPVAPYRQPDLTPGSSDLKTRLAGAVMLIAGAVLAYFSVYEPLQAAARHEEKVSISLKGAILCPLALLMGLALLILGKQSTEVFGTRERATPFAWIFGVILVLLGFGLYFYVRSILENQGYQF
jgi:hypothetical protein